MSNINFQYFKIYTTISHKESRTTDVREAFADTIYNSVNGIRAHALAMKIYKSEGETKYGEDEVKLMSAVANKFCVPGFIDGLNEQLNNNKTEEL